MKLKKALLGLGKVIVEEAAQNPGFASKLETVLGIGPPQAKVAGSRPAHRRSPPVLDPVDLARQGEKVLRDRLADLPLEQLRDVVAAYGMDSGKLVMKWKIRERVIERIVEIAKGRATKGDAFLT